MKPVITVSHLSKSFQLLHTRSLKYFINSKLRGLPVVQQAPVLRDISFTVDRNEIVGIIGRNGSGKSTLLRILAGILDPNQGDVEVNGMIMPLLELGSGFQLDLNGRDNIYLNGILLGVPRQELLKLLPAIIEFADIGHYLDAPMKFYSSGMIARLAFAIAIHLPVEILFIDEVFSVGDASFQKKSIAKLQEKIHGSGVTTVIVSHDLASLQKIANRIVVIHDGGVAFDGDPAKAVKVYNELLTKTSPQ